MRYCDPVKYAIAGHIATQLKEIRASLRGGAREKALERQAEAQAEQLAYGVFALVEVKTGVLHVNKYTFRALAALAPSWRGIGMFRCRSTRSMKMTLR